MGDEFKSAQRISRLTPLADIQAGIAAQVQRVPARETAVGNAVGLIAAEDCHAPHDMPERAIALIDGFAVRAETTSDASPYAPIPLNGIPQRLDSGDPVPPNMDAVAPLDSIEIAGGGAQAVAPATAGDGILPAGHDAKAEDVLCSSGERINARHAALLRACSIETINVRRPKILIVRAGDHDKTAPAFQMIENILRAGGVSAVSSPDLEPALNHSGADAIIGIGGTGTGRDDNSVATLVRAGHIIAHGIGIAPGESVAFGFCDRRPVLLLPGRFDAALSAWLMLGQPLLQSLAGAAEPHDVRTAKLTRKVTSTIGVTDVVLVRRDGGTAEPLTSGHWPMQALAKANGWIAIPAQSEGYPQGSAVDVRDLP